MKDNFSNQAGIYAKYRPSYPPALFDFIVSKVDHKIRAWDCATGNGQSASALANYFEKVYATDISQKQLDHAHKAPNIEYSVQAAEQTNFPDDYFDLVTVSQALHWLRFEEFYAEVKRTGRKNAWIAAWMYNLPTISPEIDKIIGTGLYKQTLEDYWDYERRWVDENYNTIPFPFDEIECPDLNIDFQWSLEELEGYISSWSAIQKFFLKNGYNPATGFIKEIAGLWEGEKMAISFVVQMRMGKIR